MNVGRIRRALLLYIHWTIKKQYMMNERSPVWGAARCCIRLPRQVANATLAVGGSQVRPVPSALLRGHRLCGLRRLLGIGLGRRGVVLTARRDIALTAISLGASLAASLAIAAVVATVVDVAGAANVAPGRVGICVPAVLPRLGTVRTLSLSATFTGTKARGKSWVGGALHFWTASPYAPRTPTTTRT